MTLPGRDLSAEGLIGAEEKLLPRLPAGIERPRDLRPAKRSVRQQPAIFPRERHALLDAVIDDQITDFGEAIDVRLPGAEIAALDRVVEETENAVAVVLVIFCGIDPALGRDAVSAARAVLVTKALHAVAQLAQRGGRRSAGQAASHHDDLKFPPIVWTDQAGVILVRRPFVGERARWNLGVQAADHNS